jgi:hypothetical protein
MMQGLLSLTSRTATTTTEDVVNGEDNEVLHVAINVTVITNTITPKIQAKDAYDNYYDVLVGSPITTTGMNVLKLGKDITAVPGASASDMVPDIYRVVMTHSNSNATTYSVALNGAN